MNLKNKINDGEINAVTDLIIKIFQNLQKVTEYGLLAFSGLCVGVQERVPVDKFGQYIKWALEGEDDECCRIACGIVTDIAGALMENVALYIDNFVPNLINVLKNENRNRQCKIVSIGALGDLCMYSGPQFSEKYLNDVLNIMESAAHMSLQINEF